MKSCVMDFAVGILSRHFNHHREHLAKSRAARWPQRYRPLTVVCQTSWDQVTMTSDQLMLWSIQMMLGMAMTAPMKLNSHRFALLHFVVLLYHDAGYIWTCNYTFDHIFCKISHIAFLPHIMAFSELHMWNAKICIYVTYFVAYFALKSVTYYKKNCHYKLASLVMYANVVFCWRGSKTWY